MAILSVLRGDPGVGSIALPPAVTFTDRMAEQILRMNEFFDTMLPGTLGRSNIVLSFSPKFSDFRDRQFVRYPLELRYGVRDRWEIFGGVSPFHPNPIHAGVDHRYGIGQAELGFRYNLGPIRGLYDAATIGVLGRSPLGLPPIDIIDRYSHVRPFISTTRRLPLPFTTFYTNFSYDREVNTPGRKQPPEIFEKEHIFEIIPGVLYKPGEFGYFVQDTFRHYAIEEQGTHLGYEYKLGTIWDVPIARTRGWKLPGKWQLELGFKFTHEDGYRVNNGITARVSWRTTLRELINRYHSSPSP